MNAKIRIGDDQVSSLKTALTRNGSISKLQTYQAKSFIHLGREWDKSQMKGTGIHELLHALNFDHEMKRFDGRMYLHFRKTNDSAYTMKEDRFLTRFDPCSVMMYPEGKYLSMQRTEGDPIWKLRQTGDKRCQELSEPNKVALNLKYKPCTNESKTYSPKLSIQTEMLYHGGQVMSTHNQVCKATTDGFCGPNNWTNCAACRVFTRIRNNENGSTPIPKLQKCLQKGKWQGLSGLFYCGKKDNRSATDLNRMKSDGVCVPDTGIPCTE